MPNEKRRFSRIVYDVRSRLTVGEQTFEAEHITDLGIGGCLLPLRSKLEAGASCRITIHLPDADSSGIIQVEGEIVRSDSVEVAVQFTSIDPDSLVHLHNIVLHNSQDTDKAEEEIRRHPGLV